MNIVWTLLVGLVIGAVAKFLMPGKDPGGFVITSLIGVAGSAVAGFIGNSLGWYSWGEVPGFIGSVMGSMLLLGGYRFTLGRAAA
jgi:uncharacterized membrane protein YeaQ/YmgE (transglycosylase-associated protein family)